MATKLSNQNLDEALAVIKESPIIDDNLFKMTKRATVFHGHICPGLSVGIIAGAIALRDARRAEDEELVVVVENDACGVDAIQTLTGCTFGKGNLIHHDYGKSVFTFFNRETGRALRLSLKPDVFRREDSDGMKALFEKTRNGTATMEEMGDFWKNHIARSREILERGEGLFDRRVIDMAPPEKARIFDSIICGKCGEGTMATRIVEKEGMNLCIPCSDTKK